MYIQCSIVDLCSVRSACMNLQIIRRDIERKRTKQPKKREFREKKSEKKSGDENRTHYKNIRHAKVIFVVQRKNIYFFLLLTENALSTTQRKSVGQRSFSVCTY